MDNEFISKRITELRQSKNLSENELSYQLGHYKTYINQITNNYSSPSINELLYICDYFSISPQTFFQGYGDENPISQENYDLLDEIISLNKHQQLLIKKVIQRFSEENITK